jgi:hypothetical protein
VNNVLGNGNFTDSLGSDSNLSTFLSSAGSDALNWGVIAEGYTGGAAANRPVGAARLVATDSAAPLNVTETNITTQIPSGFNTDVTNLNVVLSGSSALSSTLPFNGGAASALYGSTLSVDGNTPGSALTLYGVTGNGTPGGLGYAYDIGTIALNLANDTLTFTGNQVSAVPLPAAVWLLGSGLLGLAGVGRRRSIQVA